MSFDRFSSIVAILAALALAGAPAFAQEGRFYLGGAAGALYIDSDFASQVARARSADVVAPSDAHASLSAHGGGRVFGGWRISPWLALEVDYVDLGKIESSYIFYDPQVGPTGRNFFQRDATYRTNGYGASLVGSVPVSEGLDAMVRAGVIRSRIRYHEVGTFWQFPPLPPAGGGPAVPGAIPSPTFDSPDLNQTRPVLGLGVGYRISDRLRLRAEWARHFGIGKSFDATLSPSSVAKGKFDIDLFSIGAIWSF